MLKDNFGVYEVTFSYLEPSNNKNYEMRKYANSKKLKLFGGVYAIYCEEDDSIIFRKSEYLRDRSYPKFIQGKCTDALYCDSYNVPIIAKKLKEEHRYYFPKYIDRNKLTEEEFNELKKLIRKGLPTRHN